MERHELSRPGVLFNDPESGLDRLRFLALAAIALEGQDGTPYAEAGNSAELIWNDGHWHDRTPDRRHARALLHYVQS